MQKFILIRGHQGSGKSTFAKQKIQEFQQQYPNAQVIHLENDILLTDEQGNYRWSPERVDKAQRQNMMTFKNTLKQAQQNPNQAILIINSNTNQKSSACIQLMQLARKFNFTAEIYRLHNFFQNTHHVNIIDVLSAYINLNNNKLREEIHIKAIKPIDNELKQLLDKIQNFSQNDLKYIKKF